MDAPKFGYRIVRKTYGDGRIMFAVEHKSPDQDGFNWETVNSFNSERSAEDWIKQKVAGVVVSTILIREY